MIPGWWAFFGIVGGLVLCCAIYALLQALDDLLRIAFREDGE